MVASIGDEDTTDNLPDLNLAREFYAKYEVKEVLGRGVSSTVRRCIEKSSHKEYAVKIIDLTQERDNDEMTEFNRVCTKKEIQILRMCAQHPGIIELHDSFENTAFMFLVFEICKKGELFDYLTEVVTLSEKRTRHFMRQLFEVVIFIHEKMIVHRDLKPENILLDDSLNMKLSDFGFAVIVSNDEELGAGELVGTPCYMAPETIKKSMYPDAPGYGRPADMWATGVIMYTLLVGSPPFYHRKEMRMLRMIMEGQYSMNSPEFEDISDNAKDLITRLLVVDPKQRLTACEALTHPFFGRDELRQKMVFQARRKFKGSAFVVVAMNRMQSFHHQLPEISMNQLQNNPYGERNFRKIIDAGAFKIYGHWVKKGEHQNRAALFEINPKRDIKQTTESGDHSASSVDQIFEKISPQVFVRDRVGRTEPNEAIAAAAAATAAEDARRKPSRPARPSKAPMLGKIREQKTESIEDYSEN